MIILYWQIFHSHKTSANMEEYNNLPEKNSSGKLTETERLNLIFFRQEADIFMLRKAQSTVLLRWRGYSLPNP
ncbi:hypothetical protein ACSQ6I_19100 [Anabaena sp. WFMT]|uniref:hypothetical protein n=1 Tax=Anabaena sp. WFMT TaxID=3449730 RepID=UPI003F26FB45